MPKIYLAGPDVFRPDAVEHGERLKAACREAGWEGLYPIDNEIQEANGDVPLRIRNSNIAMIETCDAVVANLEPFRGPSLDAGTAFEIGFASAKGKLIVGYSKSRAVYTERVIRDYDAKRDEEGLLRDTRGWLVEEFAMTPFGSVPLVDNLMIARSLHGLTVTVEAAILRVDELNNQWFQTQVMPSLMV